MLKYIPTHHLKAPIEGVLISRKDVQRNMRTVRLEQQTQHHAQRILRDARREGELFKQHAYQEGYQQGMLSSMQHIAAFLSDNQKMVWEWREKLTVHIRAMLSVAVDHPDVLLLVLEEWLRCVPSTEDKLYLVLPESTRIMEGKIKGLLTTNWAHGAFQLDYHSETRFVLRYTDQVAEFSPEQYVEHATRLLQQHMDALPQDCRQVSVDALHKVIEQWQMENPTTKEERI